MSVPRDRISFGAHVLPFIGLGQPGSLATAVPHLPISLRPAGGRWCLPFNAVLDTGSTHTTMPHQLARDLGLAFGATDSTMEGAATDFETSSSLCDLAIVDAQFPDIHCWQIGALEVRVAEPGAQLRRPVIGWDVLGLFELKIDQSRDRIEVRLAGTGARQVGSKSNPGRP